MRKINVDKYLMKSGTKTVCKVLSVKGKKAKVALYEKKGKKISEVLAMGTYAVSTLQGGDWKMIDIKS